MKLKDFSPNNINMFFSLYENIELTNSVNIKKRIALLKIEDIHLYVRCECLVCNESGIFFDQCAKNSIEYNTNILTGKEWKFDGNNKCNKCKVVLI